MQINMETCIEYAKSWKSSTEWKQAGINECIETMVETMNLWVCNPNPFWQGKFIKLYKEAQNLAETKSEELV